MFKRSLIIAASSASLLCIAANASFAEGDSAEFLAPSSERQAFVNGPVGQTSGGAESGALRGSGYMNRSAEKGDKQPSAIHDPYAQDGSVHVPWTVNEAGFIQE